MKQKATLSSQRRAMPLMTKCQPTCLALSPLSQLCQTLHSFWNLSVPLLPQGLCNTAPSDWNKSFCSYHTCIHPSLNITAACARRSNSSWALSIPSPHSCQGCQEHKAMTTHYLGHCGALCLQRAILRAEVASRLPLIIKVANSLNLVFFFCNTTHDMYRHSSRPTWVPCGTWGAWEPGPHILLVLLTVL